MADEVKVAFGLPGAPDDTIKAWKASPPASSPTTRSRTSRTTRSCTART